jgi:PleD family two-component response regulator
LERLRMSLSESPVSLAEGPVTITASFGLTVIGREKLVEEGYVQNLIHEADTALYTAKQSGRNRVVLFIEEMESRMLYDTKKT